MFCDHSGILDTGIFSRSKLGTQWKSFLNWSFQFTDQKDKKTSRSAM